VTGAFMSRALELAGGVQGRTSPNPAVGAVVVKDGRIVGEGATEPPGGRHAEIVALDAAGEAARGGTLYVTLEPCCHQGRTPPCTDAILQAGVAEVRFAHLDPDTNVAGRGQAQLEAAGVRIAAGEGETEARRINEAYLKHRETGLPFVIAKFACSLDGKIAATSGDSRWVSGPGTLAWSHRLRTRIDAIAVGVSTVLVDDPQLTARIEDSDGGSRLAERQPLRVILDSRGRTSRQAKALACSVPTLVATTDASSEGWRHGIEETGAKVAVLPADESERVGLPALLELLGKSDVLTLLVEGGGVVLGSFFDQRLVDKVHAVIAPMIIGGKAAPTAVAGQGAARMADALRLRHVAVEQLGEDLLLTGYPADRA
jgi:diaminohydroxyphosphoribosylaminopyrimidine deaminase/5-amino-6-(5-phosphoribosylamino)uracil reductase